MRRRGARRLRRRDASFGDGRHRWDGRRRWRWRGRRRPSARRAAEGGGRGREAARHGGRRCRAARRSQLRGAAGARVRLRDAGERHQVGAAGAHGGQLRLGAGRRDRRRRRGAGAGGQGAHAGLAPADAVVGDRRDERRRARRRPESAHRGDARALSRADARVGCRQRSDRHHHRVRLQGEHLLAEARAALHRGRVSLGARRGSGRCCCSTTTSGSNGWARSPTPRTPCCAICWRTGRRSTGSGSSRTSPIHRYPADERPARQLSPLRRAGPAGERQRARRAHAAMPGTQDARWAAQRIAFQQVVGACVVEPACEAITFWGFTDRYSWINADADPDDPLPFDCSYMPKPAYDGVLDGLAGLLPKRGDNLVGNGDFSAGADGWARERRGAGRGGGRRPRRIPPPASAGGPTRATARRRSGCWNGCQRAVRSSFTAWARLRGASTAPVVAELIVTRIGGRAAPGRRLIPGGRRRRLGPAHRLRQPRFHGDADGDRSPDQRPCPQASICASPASSCVTSFAPLTRSSELGCAGLYVRVGGGKPHEVPSR